MSERQEETQESRRQEWAIWIALAMMVAPFVIVIVFLSVRGWAFLILILWVVFAESLLKRTFRRVWHDLLPEVLTEKRRDALADAALFAPVVGICFVGEDTMLDAVLVDWAVGTVIAFIMILIWKEFLAVALVGWQRWRSTK